MQKQIFLFILLAFISCTAGDDGPDINSEIRFKNFTTHINENPSAGQLIGTIDASTTYGLLTFKLLSVVPNGAVSIDESSGDILVNSVTAFNKEIRDSIYGTFQVQNEVSTGIGKFSIKLDDLPE